MDVTWDKSVISNTAESFNMQICFWFAVEQVVAGMDW